MKLPWRLIKSLASKRGREKTGMTLVEGPGPCSVGLSAAVETRFLVMTEGFSLTKEGHDILDLASRFQRKPEVFFVDEGMFRKVSTQESPRGVLMVIPFPFRFVGEGPKDFWENRLVILAVDIQDPGNVGTIIRAASACAAEAVILSSNSADPFSPKVIRASAGAVFKIRLVQVQDYVKILRDMTGKGMTIIKTSPSLGLKPWDVDLSSDIAIVLGNEGSGLSEDVLKLPGETISLPMPGGMESLNVASSASMMLYEVMRQRLKNAENRL